MNVNVWLGWIVRGDWGWFVVELVFSGDERWVMVISFEVMFILVKAFEWRNESVWGSVCVNVNVGVGVFSFKWLLLRLGIMVNVSIDLSWNVEGSCFEYNEGCVMLIMSSWIIFVLL